MKLANEGNHWLRRRSTIRSVPVIRQFQQPAQRLPKEWHEVEPAECLYELRRVPIVVLQQPANSFTTSNLAILAADADIGIDQAILEALMIPFPMIVLHEFMDGRPKRLLTEKNHPVEAFALETPKEPFHVGVQVWRAGGKTNGGHVTMRQDAPETLR